MPTVKENEQKMYDIAAKLTDILEPGTKIKSKQFIETDFISGVYYDKWKVKYNKSVKKRINKIIDFARAEHIKLIIEDPFIVVICIKM